jgi:hypothetical protein
MLRTKQHVGVEVQFHSFLTSALDEANGQLHAPASLPTERETALPIELAAGWAGYTGGLVIFCTAVHQTIGSFAVQPDWLFSRRSS